MSGGITIALLVIAFVAIGVGIAFLYFTGGLIALSDRHSRKEEEPPLHKAPTTPAQEHTHFVGVEGEPEEDSRAP